MNLDLLKYHSSLKTKIQNDKVYVYDPVRIKYFLLTSEELVRQLFIHYLIHEKRLSRRSIAVEREFQSIGQNLRFDILIFGSGGMPKMIVECKSHKVILNYNVALQASKYNHILSAEYLCITNGLSTLIYIVDFAKNSVTEIEDFPSL